MKKKLLEKMPYKEQKDPVDKIYKMAATIEMVENQKHLILDIYVKDYFEYRYPRYRIFINEKEYANYDLKEKLWNSKNFEGLLGYDISRNIEFTEKETRIVKKWVKNERFFYDTVSSIKTIQSNINTKKADRSYRLRLDKIAELSKEIKNPPRDFDKFLKENVFGDTGYIFYEFTKDRKNASGTCSACGKEIEFNLSKEKPKHNENGVCPKCKKGITYKSAGRQKSIFDKKRAIFMQKTEKGFVSRYFSVQRSSYPGEKEKIYKHEEVRVYYDGSRIYEHFNLIDGWTGEQKWYDKNYSGMYHISFGTGVLYIKNLDEVFKNTAFKYCALKELAEHERGYNINHRNFLHSYESHRFLEMFIKMGLYNLTNEYVEYLTHAINEKGKKATEILEISKENINRLIKINGGIYELRLLQLEEKNGIKITEEQIEFIVRHRIDIGNLMEIVEYTTITKFLNYLLKPIGYCNMEERISHYFDYIKMAKKLNYNLDNNIKLMPRDLRKEHDEAVLRSNEEKENTRIKEQNEKYPNIKKISRKVNEKFYFENDKYIIRAPEDAGEIVKEGNFLHHCVGGESYIPQMNEEKTYILFMRRKKDPQYPYYTLEVKDKQLKQCYGENDKKPDWEVVKEFIEDFENTKLKKKKERIAS